MYRVIRISAEQRRQTRRASQTIDHSAAPHQPRQATLQPPSPVPSLLVSGRPMHDSDVIYPRRSVYDSETDAPSASSVALSFSASSFGTLSLRTCGVDSTNFFAWGLVGDRGVRDTSPRVSLAPAPNPL